MFKDVSSDNYFARSIERVARSGLMTGYGDGTFHPKDPLLREEMASILDRLLFRLNFNFKMFPQVMKSVVMIHRGDAIGSGACIENRNGTSYILTCRHVVVMTDGTAVTDLTLVKEDMPNFAGTLVVVDAVHDLALVKTSQYLLPLVLAANPAEPGEPVAVVGSPLGLVESVDVGVVSNTDRGEWFQLDAPINPGNSGGPVINEYGEIVGVAVAKIEQVGVEGLGFAVKLEHIRDFLSRVSDKIV